VIPVFHHPGEILFAYKQLPALEDAPGLHLVRNENPVLDNAPGFSVGLEESLLLFRADCP
jgi:hypothetical protein